ncbi:MAG: hydroxymethylglutaryl-CoA lyase [Acidimicrobiales bacterium]|nr:hydroxymethylglutaryl-CoA lyase [Acidimicrobiales bacterium]
MAAHLPTQVAIRDVGPRDGLQPEAPIAVEDRALLVDALIAAGVHRIEVAAFVSPKAVPAMAGAAEVVAAVPPRPGLVRAALVPNRRGAEDAVAAGIDEVTVTISASEAYNQRNVKMSTAASEAEIAAIVAVAGRADHERGIPVDAVISCAFGSPYEGEIAPADVATLAHRLLGAGVTSITLADTTGMATPRRIDDVLDASAAETGSLEPSQLGLHLHDTRGTALVNTYRALERGVARFDTSVGGLGGSPFAHGAGGNLATEGLVAMLDDLGVRTGISIDALIDAAALVERLVGRPVPSPVAHHGPRDRRPVA